MIAAPNAAADDDDDDDDDDADGFRPDFTVDDPPMADCPLATHTTIQGAVTAAGLVPGKQKIRVCAGTYTENVLIGTGNTLELRGDSTSTVIVNGVPSTAGPILDVSSAGFVSISRMTVDGMSALSGGVVRGIRYTDTDGVISDAVVRNIRDASGGSQGLCIRIETVATGAGAEVTVRDTVTANCTRVNIIANGIGVEAHVEENVLTGPVAPKVWAPNGIQISRGAEARVAYNKVSGFTSPVPNAGAGSGILLFCAGPTKVRNNRVSGSDLGIALGDNADAKVSGNRVENSVFDAYSLQYIGTLFGPLGCPQFPSPTNNNVVSDNRARNSAEYGISLANFDPSNPVPPANNKISKNDIRGSGIDGIHVFDGTGNLLSRNRIRVSATVDPTGVDAEDDTSGTKTAGTANTWSDNDCKTDDPDGLCEDDDDEDDDDWHSFGTAEAANDPGDAGNDVVAVDTTDPETFGAVTRDMNVKVADLTGRLSVDYYIQAIELPPLLPGGAPILINRGCGGGPPRFELAVDLDGDGSFDGDAVGFIGPAPTFTTCPQNEWTHQDLTDDGLRWSLVQLGGGLLPNTWDQVLQFFQAYPNHQVQGGTLVDDSAWLPALGGLDYFDNIEIGDETMTHMP